MAFVRSLGVVILVVLISPACSVSHPTPDNTVPTGELAYRIAANTHATDPELVALAAYLRYPDKQSAIGPTLQDASAQLHGLVDVISVQDTRLIAFIDKARRGVSIADDSGKFVGLFATATVDKEKLQRPKRLIAARDGSLFVLDENAVRVLRKGASQSYDTAGVVALKGAVDDICLSNDSIYARAFAAGPGVVHQYDTEGRLLRSFGSKYKSRNESVAKPLSAGKLACVDDVGMIVTVANLLPYIYGFSASGERKWVTKITDFVPPVITEAVRNGRTVVGHKQTTPVDVVCSLTTVNKRYVLVQLCRVPPDSPETSEIRSFLVNALTGEGVPAGSQLPRVRSWQSNRLYSVNAERTQIIVYGTDAQKRGPGPN